MFGGRLFLKLIIFQHWLNNGSKKKYKQNNKKCWGSINAIQGFIFYVKIM